MLLVAYINARGQALSTVSSDTSTSTNIWGAAAGVTTAALGGGHTLYGDSSDDTFVIFSPTDQVVSPVSHGVYTVSFSDWFATYNLQNGIQNLTVSGSNDIASGNTSDNLIMTQSGNATVSGGGGDDVFVLGTGTDVVIDTTGSGSDVIYGFKPGTDHVRLDGSTSLLSSIDVKEALTQVGNDVQLNMGNGQTLTFRNEALTNFSARDFYEPFSIAKLTMTFDDEFNSFVCSPDGSKGWMTSWPYGGINDRALPANGDATYYSDASVGVNPFSVANGVLDLTASMSQPNSNPDGLPYTSGVLTTYKSFLQEYGYFEVRAELPAGKGLWPSFYMESTDNSAELDIFEVLGISPTILHATVTDHTIGGTSTTSSVIVPDTSAAFHTYGVDWEPATVTFYMDGNVIATAPTPASMNKPMYIIIGMGVGTSGSWAGAPDSNSIFPATMKIDYVRAYATAATVSVTGSASLLLGNAAPQTASLSGQAVSAGVGLAGVLVALLNGTNSVATAITDSAGKYTFSNLASGTYQVRYTALPGQTLQAGSAADAITGLAPAVTLTTGQALTLATETLAPVPVVDTLTLRVSEDAWNGDAQFVVKVDGIPVGGVESASVLHATGDSDVFSLMGDWGTGAQSVQIQFINDAYGGTAATDRNLYVNSIAYIGITASNTTATLLSNGSDTFTVGGTTAGAMAPTDNIMLQLSEDAWMGNADFTLSIDGKQVSTAQPVTALHSASAVEDFAFAANLSTGVHTIGISFTNDAYGGTPATDRNLYVDAVAVNGRSYGSGITTLLSDGTSTVQVMTAH